MKKLGIEVTLTHNEWQVCGSIAASRRMIKRPSRDAESALDKVTCHWSETWSIGGEFAAGKALGTYPIGLLNLYNKEMPDLMNGWEVRTTNLLHGCLILRPNDEPKKDSIYCFVTFEERQNNVPLFRIVGAITGTDGMVKQWVYPKNGDKAKGAQCWMVPQSALTPLTEKQNVQNFNAVYQLQVETEKRLAGGLQ